jgi:hypothetical protein
MRLHCPLLTVSILLHCTLSAFALSDPPNIRSVRFETFYGTVHPGDRVRIHVVATRPEGIRQLVARIEHSIYINSNAKNELMINVSFLPTGKPDEFLAEFVVPATIGNEGKEQLPAGRYRLQIAAEKDLRDGWHYHNYCWYDAINYSPDPGPDWELAIGPVWYHHDDQAFKSTFKIGRRRGTRPIEYAITVQDYFGRPVPGTPIIGTAGANAGDIKEIPYDFASPESCGQYRLTFDLFEKDANGKDVARQTVRQRILSDVAAGARREMILDDASTWEHQYTSDAKTRPTGKDWQPGAGVSPRFPEGKGAVWFRLGFIAPKWLDHQNCELYFSRLSYTGQVFLNGKAVGEHWGIYPFPLDITGELKVGDRNVLEICCRPPDAGRTPKGRVGEGKLLWPANLFVEEPVGPCREVRIRSYPAVHVKDVFAIPSFQKKQLGVRYTVSNATDKPQTARISSRVIDGSSSVLTVPETAVELRPGESKTVTAFRAWSDPILWWPWSYTNQQYPHLYRLATVLRVGDRELDRCDTRFGFREMYAQGRYVYFNGRKFKTRTLVTCHEGALDYGGADEKCYRGWPATLADTRQTGPSILRLHGHPAQSPMLDVADEAGVLFQPEGAMNSIHSNWADPRMWTNYHAMMKESFEHGKNHPSIVSWSMENETLICTNTWPEMYESNRKNLLGLGKFMRELDPTRLIEFHGGADIDGTWENSNLHYVRDWYKHPDLPNSAFWLKYPARNLPCDQSYPFQVTWDREIPVLMGEDGLYIRAQIPHEFSSLGGEEVYSMVHKEGYFGARPIDDLGFAMIHEGYRNAEVSQTNNATGATGGPACDAAQMPVRSFVRERDTRFFAGDHVCRNIVLHHDALWPSEVTFTWKLESQGKTIAEGSQKHDMDAGDLRRFAIEFAVPAVETPTPMTLATTVFRGREKMFEEAHEYRAYPRTGIALPQDFRVALLDRAIKTETMLKALGVRHTYFGTLESWMVEQTKGYRCIILGADGTDPTRIADLGKTLIPWVRNGGVAICLRQGGGFQEWLPMDLRYEAHRQTTIAWPRMTDHPALKNMTPEMLRYWRGDNVVSRGDFVKMPRIGWRPIVDSGGYDGLRWMSLVEVPMGKGTMILCQMDVVDKYATEPAARLIVGNLLEYAATRKPAASATPKSLQVLCGPGSAIPKVLADVDATTVQKDPNVLLVDGALPNPPVDEIAASVIGGKTVMLHGLTPENIGAWKKLLPEGLTLEKVDVKHAMKNAADALLAGISATEVWWAEYPREGDRDHEQGPTEIAYAVRVGKPIPGAVELITPGGLFKIPVGSGLLVIDQLLWDKATSPKSRLYLSLLLTNLMRRS